MEPGPRSRRRRRQDTKQTALVVVALFSRQV